MPTSSEANPDLFNIAFYSLLRQNFASIDEELGLLVNFDAMVSQHAHDSASFRTLRRGASST